LRGAVVVEASPWIEDNDWVLDLVANEPFVCAVVGNLDPEAGEFPALLERFARNPRFRGIRIRQGRPLAFDHPHLRGNLQALAVMRCTLEVVMRGADLERLAYLAAELPGLRIMLNHLAFVGVLDAIAAEVGEATRTYVDDEGWAIPAISHIITASA
jgi:L-fuconolactonase